LILGVERCLKRVAAEALDRHPLGARTHVVRGAQGKAVVIDV
jgi:hypothetical protein